MNANTDRELLMWTVYWNHLDFPGQYVARQWIVGDGEPRMTKHFLINDTLDGVRSMIPPGFVMLGRDESDDPSVVETWI